MRHFEKYYFDFTCRDLIVAAFIVAVFLVSLILIAHANFYNTFYKKYYEK